MRNTASNVPRAWLRVAKRLQERGYAVDSVSIFAIRIRGVGEAVWLERDGRKYILKLSVMRDRGVNVVHTIQTASRIEPLLDGLRDKVQAFHANILLGGGA